MLSVRELKQIRDGLKLLVERIHSLPKGCKALSEHDLQKFADSIPAYDSLISDIEKGNSHADDKELINSVIWTRDTIQRINKELDALSK